MRGHKFICHVDQTYFLEGLVPTVELCEQIIWTDDPFMAVLTFAHPSMGDNLVTIRMEDGEEYEFARTIDGRLYYVSDFWDKNEVVRRFEQTG